MTSASKTILVSGASGLVGSALCPALEARGHRVRRLSRGGGEWTWDPAAETIDPEALRGVDSIIHLAGEPVAQRWLKETKRRIFDSRVKSTALLAEAALRADCKPDFIVASGINYYGVSRASEVDETATSGEGFLAQVCRAWEDAASPLRASGARTVFVRTGIVLSAEGGALAKMLPAFKAGVGGRVGSGTQRMSWILLGDLVRIYIRAVEDATMEGPVNAVGPEPVSNTVFSRTLAAVLGRPAVFPLPTGLVKALFGEMGKETILADLAVRPTRLKAVGFEWEAEDLERAFRLCLSQNEKADE